MTTMTWAGIDPLAGRVGGGSTTTWFSLFMRWLRRALSAGEEPQLEAMRSLAGQLGEPLLAATSRDDLNDRFDAAFVRPEAQALYRLVAPRLTVDALASLAIPVEPPPELVHALGDGAAAIVTRSGPLVAAYAAILARIVAEEGSEMFTSMEQVDWSEFFSRPGIHSTVKRAVLGGLRSSMAFLGIEHATFQRQRLEPWLALALAETCRDGLYTQACLIASLPGIQMPESIVPIKDRMDLAQLQQQVDASEKVWNVIAAIYPDDVSCCDVPDDDE